MNTAWIGFDLDGTLAHDEPGAVYNPLLIGKPIPAMVVRFKQHRREGIECRIVTARVQDFHPGNVEQLLDDFYGPVLRAIQMWCLVHLGEVVPVTCKKDYGMLWLYDDRARQV